MNRRRYLAGLGATVALAGCAEGADTPDDSGGDGNVDNTDTATASPTEAEGTYEMGQKFTVGSGDKTVQYVVKSVKAYKYIGGEYSNQEASGVYAVVVVELTNQTKETLDITSNHLKLVDDQGNQFDADVGTSVYLESDGRIQADPITFDQLNPNLSTSGAVVFDVNPGVNYELLVEPLGYFSAADSKRVDLGTIESPE